MPDFCGQLVSYFKETNMAGRLGAMGAGGQEEVGEEDEEEEKRRRRRRGKRRRRKLTTAGYPAALERIRRRS